MNTYVDNVTEYFICLVCSTLITQVAYVHIIFTVYHPLIVHITVIHPFHCRDTTMIFLLTLDSVVLWVIEFRTTLPYVYTSHTYIFVVWNVTVTWKFILHNKNFDRACSLWNCLIWCWYILFLNADQNVNTMHLHACELLSNSALLFREPFLDVLHVNVSS